MKTAWLALLAWIVVSTAGMALAEGGQALKPVSIMLDQATLQKGLHVFTDVCMGCHSLRYMTWKNLMDYPEIGMIRKDVDELRGDAPLTGRMLTPLPEEDAMASYGIVPPDLSVMAKAREGHGAYIYSLLTGYEHDPKGRIPDGNYNVYFPGRRIAMSDPLGWFEHDPGDEEDLKEQARAISSFLAFVSDPHQQKRKRIGMWVLIFLVILTAVLYALKQEVWKDIKH